MDFLHLLVRCRNIKEVADLCDGVLAPIPLVDHETVTLCLRQHNLVEGLNDNPASDCTISFFAYM